MTNNSRWQLPRHEYEFLRDLFDNTNGKNWNNNTGWDFSNYWERNPCKTVWYGLTIGFSKSNDCVLYSIDLHQNNLRGRLPPLFAHFTSLVDVHLNKNFLTGPLPRFKDCLNLHRIEMRFNHFSGPLSTDMFMEDDNTIQMVRIFQLNSNHLTGSLPSWFYHFKLLQDVDLSQNSLSGTISTNISNLSSLLYFYIQENRISGTIPSSISQLKKLRSFVADVNFLSGTLSDKTIRVSQRFSVTQNNLVGPIPNLQIKTRITELFLAANYFTGTLSETFCHLGITSLTVSDNLLSGTVPSCIWSQPSLLGLELDNNHFHGPVSIPLPSLRTSHPLQVISFGFNYFTGPFPINVFSYPRLIGVSAPNNCFQGGFPRDFNCNNLSNTFTFFDLNVLYSSNRCHKGGKWISKFDYFGGSFPACFLQKGLIQIYGSGNAFTGSFPSFVVPNNSVLLVLNLSYNHFTGTIPPFLLKLNIPIMDLSYNRFKGSLDGPFDPRIFPPLEQIKPLQNISKLFLKKNRLSGRLSDISTINMIDQIDVLKGNMFTCNDDLPTKDLNFSSYFCESKLLDYAGVVSMSAMLLGILCFVLHLYRGVNKFLSCMYNPGNESPSILSHVSSLLSFYRNCFHFICISMFILLFLLFPSYLYLQNTSSNKFFDEIYRWKLSSVYLRGSVSAILILVVLFCLQISLIFILFWKKNPVSSNKVNQKHSKKHSLKVLERGAYLLVFILNAAVSISVNTFYVKRLHDNYLNDWIDERSAIIILQIGMGLYNVVWNRFVLVLAMRYLRRMSLSEKVEGAIGVVGVSGGGKSSWQYEYGLMLLLVNSLLGPWISTMLKDESCFEKLLFSKSVIHTSIGYQHCNLVQATSVEICSESISFPLPFLYYYDCGAKLLSNLLPILIYYYSLIIFLYSFEYFCLYLIQKLPTLRSSFRRYYASVVSINDSDNENKRVNMLNYYLEIRNSFLLDVGFVLCFGIHFPLLLVVILLKVLLEFSSIMKFVNDHTATGLVESSIHEENTGSEYEMNPISSQIMFKHESMKEKIKGEDERRDEKEIDSESSDMRTHHEDSSADCSLRSESNPTQYQCGASRLGVWLLICTSLLFNLIIIFDMFAEEQGMVEGKWILIVILGVMLLGTLSLILWEVMKWILNRFYSRYRNQYSASNQYELV